MAIVDGKFLRGVVGNHVTRKYRGKQVFGMKPRLSKDNLTTATLKAAKTFGIASALAKQIRSALEELIMGQYDGTMIYRLNTDTLYCLNAVKNPKTQEFNFQSDSFERLNGFEFNADSKFKNILVVQPSVVRTETQIQVVLPQLNLPKDIRSPKNSYFCRFTAAIAAFDLANGKYKYFPLQSVDIKTSGGQAVFPGHTFEFEAEPGCLCVTAASLQFFKQTASSERSLNSKDFSPMAILDAYIFDGTANSDDENLWEKFHSKKLQWTEAVQMTPNT